MSNKMLAQLMLLLTFVSLQYFSFYKFNQDDEDLMKRYEAKNDFKDPWLWFVFIVSVAGYSFFKLSLHKWALRMLKQTFQRHTFKKLLIITVLPLVTLTVFLLMWHLQKHEIIMNYVMETNYEPVMYDMVNDEELLREPDYDYGNHEHKFGPFLKPDMCPTRKNAEKVISDEYSVATQHESTELAESSLISKHKETDSKIDTTNPEANKYPEVTLFDLDIVNSPQTSAFTLGYSWLHSILAKVSLKIIKFLLILYSLLISMSMAFLMAYYGLKALQQHHLNILELNQF